MRTLCTSAALSGIILLAATSARAGQAPFAAAAPDFPVSHHDRVYAAEQFSNTVSVIDPASNTLLGEIRLGEPSPTNFSPLYKGQVLCARHGILARYMYPRRGIDWLQFRDLYRHQHERRKTHDLCGPGASRGLLHPGWQGGLGDGAGRELHRRIGWRYVRGEDPNNSSTGRECKSSPPDGKYGYVCSSFNPETDVVSVADHRVVAKLAQASPFCPNIAATPDGSQVWFTLKDTGKTQVFEARPPFALLKTLDTGPITNHVNIARNARGMFAYVTIGGTNQVRVFRTDNFSQVATIPVGKLPHGVWPSGDGTRVYVGLENDDRIIAIDTPTNKVIASIPIGQAPQAVVYVPDAVPADVRGNPGIGAAWTRWSGRAFHPGVTRQQRKSGGSSTHQRDAVRSGFGASTGSICDRPRGQASLCARLVRTCGRCRHTGSALELHHQSRRSGDCECGWTHTPSCPW